MRKVRRNDMLSGFPLLAVASAPRDPTEWVGPGLLGFVVIAALCVATVLLWRNMNKQLRKVDFEEKPDPRATDGSPEGGRRSASEADAADAIDDESTDPASEHRRR